MLLCVLAACLWSRHRARAQAFREAVGGASSELLEPEGKRAESAVVKKLKQPKKRKKKDTAKSEEGGKEEEEEEEEEGEEENKGGVGSLMIVKTAGEAWQRLQERLKEAPIIQVTRNRGSHDCVLLFTLT